MRDRLPAIAFQPRPSRQLTVILFGLQLLTLAVLLVVPILVELRLSLLSLLMVQTLSSHRRLRGTASGRITHVRIDDDHAARLVYADGGVQRTRLRGDSLIAPGLILLRFEGGSILRRPSLLLGRDSISSDEMRRLRILLRIGGHRSGAGDQAQ